MMVYFFFVKHYILTSHKRTPLLNIKRTLFSGSEGVRLREVRISNTREVFHHISKHLEFHQKYSATRCIFNSLLGVWKYDETLSPVFDILCIKHVYHHKSILPTTRESCPRTATPGLLGQCTCH